MEQSEFAEIARQFNDNNIKYLLIGRQAVVLYGLAVTSIDYDIWTLPEYRNKVFDIMFDNNFEPSSDKEDKKPLVFFIKDFLKIDVFFVKGFGKLNFEECYNKATVLFEEGLEIRIPSPEDLIYLKSFRKPLKEKDKIDIEFLKTLIKRKKK